MDKENFDEMMSMFGKVWDKGLPYEVLKIYFEIFEEIPNNKTKYIIKCCIKKCKYFPRPADVFECLGELDPFKKYYEKE